MQGDTNSFFEENAIAKGSEKVAGSENKDSFLDFDEKQQEQSLHVKKHYRKLNRRFTAKELLDRIGYGFGASQFITILFFLTGATPLLVGFINGFKDVLASLFSSFLQEFSKVNSLSKRFISSAGILFGFSLIGIVLAIRMSSPWTYAIALLVGSFGIVAYGERHHRIINASLRHERKSLFLKRITHYGLLITALSFLLSGYLLETFGIDAGTVSLFGMTIRLSGYFLAFEIAAIAFICSGFILSKTPLNIGTRTYKMEKFLRGHFKKSLHEFRYFLNNKYLFMLFIGALLLSVIESLGATFYGYHIFTLFRDQYLGGFLNVALIFIIALLISTAGPFITRFLERHIGLAPMFVFGTMLMTLLPFIFMTNPHFYAVIAATSLAIIGSSILGASQGLLVQKLLPAHERSSFFNSIGVIIALPFLLLVIAGSMIAMSSFLLLFKIMVIILLAVVAPLYIALVLTSHKQRL